MTKKISIAVPDEPFKNTFDQGKTVEITYTGPEVIVFSVDPETNKVRTVDGYFNSIDEVDLSAFNDDHCQYVAIEARAHLLESALLTSFYTNTAVEPYVETLVTGEEWEYRYPEQGILGDIFYQWNLQYFLETNSFGEIEYQTFGTTREQFLESLTNHIAFMTAQKEKAAEDGESEETLARYDEIISWCENFEETYGDTDHWKVPFPTL